MNPWDYTFVAPNAHKPPAIHLLAATRFPQRLKLTPTERVVRARESSLDYEFWGPDRARIMVPDEARPSAGRKPGGRVALGGMRAWNGIIEVSSPGIRPPIQCGLTCSSVDPSTLYALPGQD